MKPIQVYNQTTQGLPSWAKGVIAVSVIAAVGIVAYKVYKLLQVASTGTDEKETIRLVDKEIKDKIKAGDSPSFALSKYNSTASSIETMLAGIETTGTEIKVIKEVIDTVKKPIDWLLLTRAFGKRNVPDAFWGSTPYELGGLLKEQLDQTLTSEFDVITPNFKYDPAKSGNKTSFDVLQIYLKKIGVQI
jgi:hypothetical protein